MTEVHTDRVEFGKDRAPNPTPQGGTLIQPANTTRAQPADPKNPLGEETIRVRVRPGMEFYFMGDLVREGDEFDAPISMARAASLFLDDISSGQPKAVPHEQQVITGAVPRADVAGRPTHERIGLLEDEEKRLNERLGTVRKQLELERSRLAQAQQKQADQQPPQQQAPPAEQQQPPQAQPAPVSDRIAPGDRIG